MPLGDYVPEPPWSWRALDCPPLAPTINQPVRDFYPAAERLERAIANAEVDA